MGGYTESMFAFVRGFYFREMCAHSVNFCACMLKCDFSCLSILCFGVFNFHNIYFNLKKIKFKHIVLNFRCKLKYIVLNFRCNNEISSYLLISKYFYICKFSKAPKLERFN